MEMLSQMGEMLASGVDFLNKSYTRSVGQMPITYQLDSRAIKTNKHTQNLGKMIY